MDKQLAQAVLVQAIPVGASWKEVRVSRELLLALVRQPVTFRGVLIVVDESLEGNDLVLVY